MLKNETHKNLFCEECGKETTHVCLSVNEGLVNTCSICGTVIGSPQIGAANQSDEIVLDIFNALSGCYSNFMELFKASDFVHDNKIGSIEFSEDYWKLNTTTWRLDLSETKNVHSSNDLSCPVFYYHTLGSYTFIIFDDYNNDGKRVQTVFKLEKGVVIK